MARITLVAVTVLAIGASAIRAGNLAAAEPIEHALYACEEFSGQFHHQLALSFADHEFTSGRSLQVFSKKQDVIIVTQDVKHVFAWDLIKVVRFIPVTEESGLLEIELNEPIDLPHRPGFAGVNFGIMPLECWDRVVSVFESEVPTEVAGKGP
ncbi:MAG TPA: hypothetical protein EYH07_15700 [Kiloniellaceae bacterium]|nr:hypothetical protein [Kiloniellaceae bacterium]